MVDVVAPEKRSQMMSGIKGKNTKPELIIRKGLHKKGFRYKLHESKLPGKPDLVFPKYKAVILVNGCFWHRHDCHLFQWPSTRPEFWRNKILKNVKKDADVMEQLHDNGWRVMLIWECAIKGKDRISIENIISEVSYWLINGSGDSQVRGRDVD